MLRSVPVRRAGGSLRPSYGFCGGQLVAAARHRDGGVGGAGVSGGGRRSWYAAAGAVAATTARVACCRRASTRAARCAPTVDKPLTPSSPSQFLGESEVRASQEELQKNRELFNHAVLPETEDSLFRLHKQRILEKTLLHDRSPKGSVDYRIMGILDELNKREQFVTTSSCSGRVLFVSHDCPEGEEVALTQGARTHTGRWRISHDGIADADEYFDLEAEPLRDNTNYLWLHVQAMELQVACENLAEANRLMAVIKKVFNRAYVKSASREWKTLVYVEGSQHVQMPFALSGRRVYSGSNEELARIVNSKLQRNWADMERLLQVLRTEL